MRTYRGIEETVMPRGSFTLNSPRTERACDKTPAGRRW